MTDAELISCLRSQHTELAHRAADIIEGLIASEAEARIMFDVALKTQTALLAKLPAEKRSSAAPQMLGMRRPA
jgi:hypothetical protein